MEYELREIWYSFEGGIGKFEIPLGNIKENISENINPIQTEPSLLVKTIAKSEE